MKLEDIEVGVIFTAFRIEIGVDERKSETFGYYLDKEIGLELTKGKGWYGGNGYATEINCIKLKNGDVVTTGAKPLRINNSSNIGEAKKNIALSKLTDEEKNLLGL